MTGSGKLEILKALKEEHKRKEVLKIVALKNYVYNTNKNMIGEIL